MRTSVREKAVVETMGGPVADGVAVAFVQIFVVESFGVGKTDAAALTAGNHETGVSGGQRFAIEKNVDMTSGRHGYRCAGECAQVRGVGPNHLAWAATRGLHGRQLSGDQGQQL